MGGRSIITTGTLPRILYFEWDPVKSASNKLKHGVDFDEATAIWNDPGRARLRSTSPGVEPRQLIVGRIDGKLYTAVVTLRGQAIRIISVRRARRKEGAHHAGS
ncbi:MAG: BrnT family toxin [Micrococcales bacterium]|nr:BrnT family toxin [Micrococcales bacterium]